MKKKETKKDNKRKYPDKRQSGQYTDLGDLGLEPPKIYRESQKNIISEAPKPSRRPKSERAPMTKQEKRQLETKKRKAKNKIRRFLIWLAVAVLLVSVGAVLSLTVFFHIESITVVGNERYSEEEIISLCTVNAGENMFLADTDGAAVSLEQSLPYIYNASIKRKIPSTIEINITEAQPSYYISNNDNETYILLDDNFKVLEDRAEECSGIEISQAEIISVLPGRQIEFGDENVAECLSKMAQAVKENNITQITAIYSNNLADNYLVYDNRIHFKVGTCDNLDKKLWQGLTSCDKLNESSPNAKGTMTIAGDKQIYFTEDFS